MINGGWTKPIANARATSTESLKQLNDYQMESTRQEKISRLLQKELGDIFLTYARNRQGVLISVSEVRVSPDLGIAHSYLSIFPTEKIQEVIEQVQLDTKAIRYDLGKRVRHQLRVIPELFFHVDNTLDQLENIDRLLNS